MKNLHFLSIAKSSTSMKKKFLFDFATSIIFHEIIIRTEMKIKEFG